LARKKAVNVVAVPTLLLMYTYKMDMIAAQERKIRGGNSIDRYLSSCVSGLEGEEED
jgi:hypothetical protein